MPAKVTLDDASPLIEPPPVTPEEEPQDPLAVENQLKTLFVFSIFIIPPLLLLLAWLATE